MQRMPTTTHAEGDLVILTRRGQFVPGLAHLAGRAGAVIAPADSRGMLIVAFDGDDLRGVPSSAVEAI